MTDRTEADAAGELARAAAGVQPFPVDPDETSIVLVRDRTLSAQGDWLGDKVSVLDLAPWASKPARRKGTAAFDQPASFERYVQEFKIAGQTRIYADLSQSTAVAVFDDDTDVTGPPAGEWRDHRATLKLRESPEWAAWTMRDGKLGSQLDLAEHLEANLDAITEPAAADLVEVARSFQATNNASFRSALSLTSGEVRFAYDESIDAKAGEKGSLVIPATFKLLLPVYEGTDPIEMTARLRYRVGAGTLTIGYALLNADRVKREAFAAELGNIGAATGCEPYFGTPAPPR